LGLKFHEVATFKFRSLSDGQATPVPPGEFTVGRTADAYIHVDDSSVSRHHARLINEGNTFFVEDLGSANGVAVRGAYVTGRAKINFGDHVHIGKVPFRIDPEVPGESSGPTGLPQRADHALLRKETERIDVSKPLDIPTPAPAADARKEMTKSSSLVRKSVPLPDLVKLMEASPQAAPAGQASADQAGEASPVAEQATAESEEAEAKLAAASAGADSGEPGLPHIIRMPIRAEEGEAQEPAPHWTEEPTMMEDTSPWWHWALVFLAGMGLGLLLGLIFAKAFLEMGGKPGLLP